MEETRELAALVMNQSHPTSAHPVVGRGPSPKRLYTLIRQEMGPNSSCLEYQTTGRDEWELAAVMNHNLTPLTVIGRLDRPIQDATIASWIEVAPWITRSSRVMTGLK